MAKSRTSRLRWPAFAVVFVLLAITISSTIGSHHANQIQERRLLRERATEVAGILTDAFSSLQTQVSTIAAETALNGANPRSFLAASNALAGGFMTGLARLDPATARIHFIATTGSLPATPQPVVDTLLHRALSVSSPGVTSAVLTAGSSRALGMALSIGRNNLVVYEQFPLDLAAFAKASTRKQQFHELRVALYAGPRRDPNDLLLTTNGSTPPTGSVVTAHAPFGADRWLVVVQATRPLTGSFAAQAYWVVLAIGLVLTALVGYIVVTLLRRRDYAMALVAERTVALEDSMRELERTQEQLVRSERLAAIGELASVVGHELRNPLGVITNAHYLLRTVLQRKEPDADIERHLSTAEREVGAATLIVGDLLDYARGREPVPTAVQVPDVITEVQSILPPPPDVTVTRDDEPGLPPVRADRDQLRQVLLNILSNAYEAVHTAAAQAGAQSAAGPNGGSVSVRTLSADGKVSIVVADTGVGMDEQTQAQAFEPFFTRKTRGTGLGLAVTRRIVDSHGGVIHIDSTLGQGTTFTVDFPVADDVPASGGGVLQ